MFEFGIFFQSIFCNVQFLFIPTVWSMYKMDVFGNNVCFYYVFPLFFLSDEIQCWCWVWYFFLLTNANRSSRNQTENVLCHNKLFDIWWFSFFEIRTNCVQFNSSFGTNYALIVFVQNNQFSSANCKTNYDKIGLMKRNSSNHFGKLMKFTENK